MQIPYDITQNPLNTNEWSFPLMECIHIAMFAMSIGTIAVVDFRLLGLLFTERSPSDLLKSTSIWTLIGLICVVSTGMIIFTTDPLSYYYNWSFRYKMIALLIAIVFNYTIHRSVAMSNASSAASVMTGAI